MSKYIAGILTIGDELLIGQIMDTNGPWLSRKRSEGGWKVRHHVTVGDRENDIVEALKGLAGECQVILVTGGLGPTVDDVTLQAAASSSNRPLVCFPEVEQKISLDRKSTRLNSSHVAISYAVFCLKKKKDNKTRI